MVWRWWAAAAVAFGVLAAGCATDGQPVPSPGVSGAVRAPIDLAETQGRWWSWAASRPSGSDPVSDLVGTQCHVNQPDDLWFVAGTFGGKAHRRCVVPAGRALVGPAVNLVSTPEDCRDFLDAAEGTVTLDGAPVTLRRTGPTRLTVRAVEGSAIYDEAGDHRGCGCGLWFEIEPPAPGPHELRIKGGSDGLAVEVVYDLVVGDRS
ncbi:hypothetical protein V5P93_004229 [Actinokineospora auranticolor]|nr:signal protein [Actinokineospora auranticolor]